MTQLHSSLIELRESAPHCASIAAAKEMIAESQILLRNSISHEGANSWALTQWFSELVSEVFHSPAVAPMRDGAEIILTGAFGRGHGLPTSGVQWLFVGDNVSPDIAALTQFCESTHLVVHSTDLTPARRHQWSERIATAVQHRDGAQIGVYADAGGWFTAELSSHRDAAAPLLAHAVQVRPPAVSVADGLPTRDRVVNLHMELVVPLAHLARWAGVKAHSTATETDRRIADAERAGVLSPHEAAYLTEAWTAAVDLQLRRWADRAGGHIMPLDMLPQLDRSAFGAASRMLSDVFSSLLHREGA